MRTILSILIIFTVTNVAGQNWPETVKNHAPAIYGEQLTVFLDSLRNGVLKDTVKFQPADLIFTALGRPNTKPYSPLFIINGAYLYKLDIINGSQVVTFVNEMLDDKKIKSVTVLDSSKAPELLGRNARQGVILITTFDKARFNPKVAGLVLRKNKTGNNFTARRKGEMLIRE
jgi:hypothetical protein